MPETLSNGIVVPETDLEPADMYGVARRLGESVNDALDFPYVDLRASAATSIANNSWRKVDLATTTHADTDYFTVASSVVTVTEAGLYDMNGAVFWEGSSFNYGGSLSADGAPPTVFYKKSIVATTFHYPDPTALGYYLDAGAKVQLSAFQNSGGALSTTHSADKMARLFIRKIG